LSSKNRTKRRALEETFDLILMDIGLPDGDGRDVCCELRRSAHAQKTRIVALTGHADLKGSSCMSDFDGCIVKPITMQALEDLLAHLDNTIGVTRKHCRSINPIGLSPCQLVRSRPHGARYG
jgi:DNA-binding response OmpR family regulator